MTIEEKAKAYDKALNWMRELYQGLHGATKEDAEHYFPALKESEDERMMRVIGLALTDVPEGRFTSLGTTLKDCLAYLEKQKEQKPVVTHGEPYLVDTVGTQQEIAGKMPQKPAEWSEEDEEIWHNIIWILKKDVTYTPPTRPNSCTGSGNAFYTHQTEIDWLKSIRPQPHWKPSNEQINYLGAAVIEAQRRHNESVNGFPRYRVLKELYEQLLKL